MLAVQPAQPKVFVIKMHCCLPPAPFFAAPNLYPSSRALLAMLSNLDGTPGAVRWLMSQQQCWYESLEECYYNPTSDAYLDMLVHEIKPFVDAKYR